MTDLNSVFLIGRVVRDITTNDFVVIGSTPKLSLSIAVNRSKKQNDQWVDEASFFDVTVWGKQAETIKNYISKGKQIAVQGYLKQDRWEKDGQKFSKVAIVADNIQLLSGNNSAQPQQKTQQTPPPVSVSFDDMTF